MVQVLLAATPHRGPPWPTLRRPAPGGHGPGDQWGPTAASPLARLLCTAATGGALRTLPAAA
eukprot:13897833-Heterocapsa_arctica.AAC.1